MGCLGGLFGGVLLFFKIIICNEKVIDAKPRRPITQTEFPYSVETSPEQILAGSNAALLPHWAALIVGAHRFLSSPEVGRAAASGCELNCQLRCQG